jgi:hypothetical protein
MLPLFSVFGKGADTPLLTYFLHWVFSEVGLACSLQALIPEVFTSAYGDKEE